MRLNRANPGIRVFGSLTLCSSVSAGICALAPMKSEYSRSRWKIFLPSKSHRLASPHSGRWIQDGNRRFSSHRQTISKGVPESRFKRALSDYFRKLGEAQRHLWNACGAS